MIYDFDHGPERRGTNCLKYDFARERGKPADVLPLWVAGMDFPAPAPVLAKIHAMADHGIFGYTDTKPAYDAAVCGWFRRRFGWDARPEWLVKTPGVVFALAMAVRADSTRRRGGDSAAGVLPLLRGDPGQRPADRGESPAL